MRLGDVVEGEAVGVDEGFEGTGVCDAGEGGEDVSVILATIIVQHGDQHEDHVQRQALEVGGAEIEFDHSDCAGNLTVQGCGFKETAHIGTADRVEDDIKAVSAGVSPLFYPFNALRGRVNASRCPIPAVMIGFCFAIVGIFAFRPCLARP